MALLILHHAAAQRDIGGILISLGDGGEHIQPARVGVFLELLMVYEQFKEDTYTRGLNVFTTITKADQDAAYIALRRGVMEYEKRHGYRGPEGYIDLPASREG